MPFADRPSGKSDSDSTRLLVYSSTCLLREAHNGKMLGCLTVRDKSGRETALYAFSGQADGSFHKDGYVPPVFDYLAPGSHFPAEEAAISAINARVGRLRADPRLIALQAGLAQAEAEEQKQETTWRQTMAEHKLQRQAERANAANGSRTPEELVRESQYEKAELRRIRQRAAARLGQIRESLKTLLAPIEALEAERKRRSEELQTWLFSHFIIHDWQGRARSLLDIFAEETGQLPPSGAGECCAPKLLDYAFKAGLTPLRLTEYWCGPSPQGEIRHHGQQYPPCRSKCRPLLRWMLRGAPEGIIDWQDHPDTPTDPPQVLFEDDCIIVADKPSGMLTVPGRDSSLVSLEEYLRGLRPTCPDLRAAHRLDQDTSGLVILAKTREAYTDLQRQFAERTVKKTYTAAVPTAALRPDTPAEGDIELPLAPDLDDRPRQKIDFQNGKPAFTHYEITGQGGGETFLRLTPHTGRTHQLRLHCAHPLGLGAPIIGDRLYGLPGFQTGNLRLRAVSIEFRHPETGDFQSRQVASPVDK